MIALQLLLHSSTDVSPMWEIWLINMFKTAEISKVSKQKYDLEK
jgi:hypothetical protein